MYKYENKIVTGLSDQEFVKQLVGQTWLDITEQEFTFIHLLTTQPEKHILHPWVVDINCKTITSRSISYLVSQCLTHANPKLLISLLKFKAGPDEEIEYSIMYRDVSEEVEDALIKIRKFKIDQLIQ